MGKLLRTCAVAAAVLAGLQLDAAADPIAYDGQLPDGGGSGVGALPPSSTVQDATGADYWSFWATAGDIITVNVARLDGELDPAMFVYGGYYFDTTDPGLASGNILSGGSKLIDFGDDENPPAVPGPWGDPESTFVAPETGWYTVAVTSFLSGAVPPDGDYDYSVSITGNTGYSPNPEPSTVLLLSGALAAAGAWRRRRTKRHRA